MQKLINSNYLPDPMKSIVETDLELRINELLDKAMPLIPLKGRALTILRGDLSYEIFQDGIYMFWKTKRENGDPITRKKNLTRNELIQSLSQYPSSVQEQICQNISDYIGTETPKERGEEEFPQENYPG